VRALPPRRATGVVARTSAPSALRLGLAIAGLAIATRALAAPQPTPEPQAVTIGKAVVVRGEVVETSCFLRDGKRGEGHRACALVCLKNGGQLGIVEDTSGTFYSLATNSPGTDPNAAVKEFVAQHVSVDARLYERGGQKMLVIQRVQRLGD
jgi:hypothetical protein